MGQEASNGNGSGGGKVKKETFERTLRVILTGEQVAERADRSAHLMGERDSKEQMASAAQKHAKSEIAEIDATIRRLSSEVRDKATYLPIICTRVFDYQLGKVIETRTDTGEAIDERPMTAEERQMEFDHKPGGSDSDLDDDFDREA